MNHDRVMPADRSPAPLGRRLTRLFDQPPARVIGGAILIITTAILIYQTYRKTYRPIGIDFSNSYLLAAEALAEGRNPYDLQTPFPYLYPLFLAFLLIPIVALPLWLSTALWLGANIASLTAAVGWAIRTAGPTLRTTLGGHLLGPLAFIALLLVSIIQNNLRNGQVNFILLALCMIYLHASLRGRPCTAAAALGAAIAIKIVPGVLLLFALMRRQWAVAAGAFGLAVVLCLLPGVLLGAETIPIYRDYLAALTSGKLDDIPGPTAQPLFFNPAGFIDYLLPGYGRHRLVELSTAALVVAAVLIVDWRMRDRRSPPHETWMLALYLTAIPLASPISETHHLAFVIPAVVLLGLKFLYDERWFGRGPTLLIAACLLLYAATKLDRYGPWYFLLVALLFAMQMWAILAMRHDERPAQATG